MSAVAYRMRAEWRERRWAWSGLALLLGIAGGAVTASAAGVGRTESAHSRFLSAQHAADMLIGVDCAPGDGTEAIDTSCIAELRSDPAVAGSALVRQYSALVHTLDGVSIEVNPSDNCYSGPGDLAVTGDVSGDWGRSINRHRFVAGRAADPARKDEVVISETIADRLGLGPGDHVRATFPNTDPVCTDDGQRYPHQTFEFDIVGVQRSPMEILPTSGFYLSSLHLTPAFTRDAGTDAFAFDEAVAVRLRDGVDRSAFVDSLSARGWQAEAFPAAELWAVVEDGHRPYASALAASAIVGLLAVAAVLTPATARRMRLDTLDRPLLWALGVTRGQLRVLAAIRALVIATLAATVCIGAATLLSALFPIGPPRAVDPDPGLDIAGAAVLLGALAVAAIVLLAALPVLLKVQTSLAPSAAVRRPRFAGRGASLPVTAWCGIRLAFARASAAAGGVVALSIAVTGLVGALTFGAGVQHLVTTPRLVGLNWEHGLLLPETNDLDARRATARELSALVARDPLVAGHATGTIWSTIAHSGAVQLGPDRIEAAVFGFDAHGVEPSIITGRSPAAPDEVLLGPKTIDRVGLEVGDTIEAYGYEGRWEEEPVPTTSAYRIVGTATMPVTDVKGIGHGALLTLDGVRRLNTYSVPDAIWLRLSPGVETASLSYELSDGTRVTEADIWNLQDELIGADDLAISSVDAAPKVVAGLLALLSSAVLLHLLVGATFRNRGPLAVLGALGCTRGQARRTVGWQAIAFVTVPVLAGVPLGVAAGRITFHEFASRLGVVPEPVTSWTVVALVVPAAAVLALLAAAIPARRAARLRPAAVLRAE